jgi:hypothetical protein
LLVNKNNNAQIINYSLFATPITCPSALGLTSSLVQEVNDATDKIEIAMM